MVVVVVIVVDASRSYARWRAGMSEAQNTMPHMRTLHKSGKFTAALQDVACAFLDICDRFASRTSYSSCVHAVSRL